MDKKKNQKYLFIFVILMLVAIFGANIFLGVKDSKEAEANYDWSYERACENGDLAANLSSLSKNIHSSGV